MSIFVFYLTGKILYDIGALIMLFIVIVAGLIPALTKATTKVSE